MAIAILNIEAQHGGGGLKSTLILLYITTCVNIITQGATVIRDEMSVVF